MTPTFKILLVAEPSLAQFLMNLNPEWVKKAGLSNELFGDDPKGLMGGLIFQEGKDWHHSRKMISHNFNLADVSTLDLDVGLEI